MPFPLPARARQHGFTLVELMVASAIGLAILAAMSTLFLSNSRAQGEIERANRQIENGRYAIQLILSDLRSAGFYGEFDPSVLPLPAALNDPCSTDLDKMKENLTVHLQGYDNSSGGLSCIDDVKSDTDVLVVRHTALCLVGDSNCADTDATGPFFQASLCNNNTELDSGTVTDSFKLAETVDELTLHKRNCTTVAAARRVLVHIYFVASNDKTGDGIPTLKRAELTQVGSDLRFVVQPLVNGVDNLHFEYGIDRDNDGVPDLYSSDPATADGCADAVCAVDRWAGVMNVKVNVLARSSDTTKGFVDGKKYEMGLKADGSKNTVTPPADQFKRHLFQSLASLPNPAGRRAK